MALKAKKLDTVRADVPTASDENPTGVIRGKKRIITVGIGLDLMPRLDAAAARLSISRAAFINMAIVKTVENTEQS